MCTVTYLPQADGSFLLTTNRDEAPHRSPRHLTETELFGQQLAFPRDAAAGGTWVAVADSDRLVCILNGAFAQHERHLPYRRSRGLMVLDYFSFRSAETFFRQYRFRGMESFTMIVYDGGRLYDLRWDEAQVHLHALDPAAAHLWSSPTLYTPEWQQKRRDWFAEWRTGRQAPYDRQAILDFHRHAGEGDPWNDLVMNREEKVRTVSITSIAKRAAAIDLCYHDLLRGGSVQTQLALRPGR